MRVCDTKHCESEPRICIQNCMFNSQFESEVNRGYYVWNIVGIYGVRRSEDKERR